MRISLPPGYTVNARFSEDMYDLMRYDAHVGVEKLSHTV
jgi:hypothetical protein